MQARAESITSRPITAAVELFQRKILVPPHLAKKLFLKSQMNWNFPSYHTLGEGKGWRLVPARGWACLPRKDFTQFWQLALSLASEKKREWHAGSCLDQDCLVVHTPLAFSFNLNPIVRVFQRDLEGSVDLFIFHSSKSGHTEYILLFFLISPLILVSLVGVFRIRHLSRLVWEARARCLVHGKQTH